MSLRERAQKLADAAQRTAPIDWQAERVWWEGQLISLYANIGAWLHELREAGLVKLEKHPVRIRESNLDEYSVDALVLVFPNDEAIVFQPKGTIILGARGRVDVYSRARPEVVHVLLLAGETKEAARWVFFKRPPSQSVNLDQALLESMLESLLPASP